MPLPAVIVRYQLVPECNCIPATTVVGLESVVPVLIATPLGSVSAAPVEPAVVNAVKVVG